VWLNNSHPVSEWIGVQSGKTSEVARMVPNDWMVTVTVWLGPAETRCTIPINKNFKIYPSGYD